MTGGDKIRAFHLDVFKTVLNGLVARIPFGVEIDEEAAVALVDEAEDITHVAVMRLKPVLIPTTASRKGSPSPVFPEEEEETTEV